VSNSSETVWLPVPVVPTRFDVGESTRSHLLFRYSCRPAAGLIHTRMNDTLTDDTTRGLVALPVADFKGTLGVTWRMKTDVFRVFDNCLR